MNRRKNITVLARELYCFSHQVKRKTTSSILQYLPFCLCHLEEREIPYIWSLVRISCACSASTPSLRATHHKRGKNTELSYHPLPTIQNPLRLPSQGDRKQKSSSWTWFRIFLLLSCSPLLRGLGGAVFIYKHYPEEFHFRICRSRRRRWIYSFSLQVKKRSINASFFNSCYSLHILMLHDTIRIPDTPSRSICLLPRDRIDRTGSDCVIDLIFAILYPIIHTRESFVIHTKHITSNHSARATPDTCWVHMRFFDDTLEGLEFWLIDHKTIRKLAFANYTKIAIISKKYVQKSSKKPHIQ